MSSLAVTIAWVALCGATGHGQASADLEDLGVSAEVRRALESDPLAQSERVQVATVDGVVTLRGPVEHLLAKQRAVELALAVRGVRSVVDTIVVRPVLRADAIVRDDVRAALAADRHTAGLPVEAAVEGGVVHLRGTVESGAERMLVLSRAAGVRGVQDVRDDIRIEYPAVRTDDEILRDLRAALAWDAHVDARHIEVAVTDGTVDLRGAVATAALKHRVESRAWQQRGVSRVDAGGLRIDPGLPDAGFRDPRRAERADDEIAGAVRRALQRDPRVRSEIVAVEVDDGVVTLRGQVTHLGAKQAADDDAQNTVGVVGVTNEITVRSPDRMTDLDLARLVRAALSRDPIVASANVEVSVRDRTVFLAGEVDSPMARRQAERVASQVTGVEDLVSRVTERSSR